MVSESSALRTAAWTVGSPVAVRSVRSPYTDWNGENSAGEIAPARPNGSFFATPASSLATAASGVAEPASLAPTNA